MSPQQSPQDPWRWPTLLLWLVFFALGLWPEMTFALLRAAGYVFTQNAIINSYNFITWCLTGFVGYFVYQRCLEAELPPPDALLKAIQLGVLAFVAFIDLPVEQIPEIHDVNYRALVLGTLALKLLVWLYLYSLVARYHWTRRPQIVAGALPYFALIPAANSGSAATTVREAKESSAPSSVENPAE